MGRTKRQRSAKRMQLKNTNLDHEGSTVNLRQWLNRNNFSDPLNLQLRNFTQTGRGVTSKKAVNENDVLVRVPLNLLITFDTVEASGLLKYLKKNSRFSTQTLISFYLALEKHKGQHSIWKHYINTLPNPEPVLPWMCQPELLENFPDDLRFAATKLQEIFLESLARLRKSISPTALCDCCETPINRVLRTNLFKWSYVLVNTRAVYIDPKNIISKNSSNISILSDEPSMALCPFLDMFNHSHLAQTKVSVVSIQGQCFYELRTMSAFKKYEQFFISYGPHDNVKLLMEYGFFIPENSFDCVTFTFKAVVDVLKLVFDEKQYRFIKKHKFDALDLHVSFNDMSFNLKSVLFVAHFPGVLNLESIIFSNTYPSDFDKIIRSCTENLLNYKLLIYENDVKRLSLEMHNHFNLVKDFLDYRLRYVKKLRENKLF